MSAAMTLILGKLVDPVSRNSVTTASILENDLIHYLDISKRCQAAEIELELQPGSTVKHQCATLNSPSVEIHISQLGRNLYRRAGTVNHSINHNRASVHNPRGINR